MSMRSEDHKGTEGEAPLSTRSATSDPAPRRAVTPAPATREIGGRTGPEPTRFGDWEKDGRCIDF